MFKFTQSIGYDGIAGNRKYANAGDIVTTQDILQGCLESCLRLGILVPHESQPVETESVSEELNERKSKRGRPRKADTPDGDPSNE